MKRELKVDWVYLEAALEKAMNKAITPDALDDLVVKHAQEAIEDAVASEIKEYFYYGDGRTHIRDAVLKRLDLYKGEA
jgi:hypothetical protein